MADFNLYFPSLVKLEGSTYEIVEHDMGGCTHFGLTAQDMREYYKDLTLSCESVKVLELCTASPIVKKLYWDFFKGDLIKNQSLAEFIVDGGYNMGRVLIAKYVQNIVHVGTDGKVGPITIGAVNSFDGNTLFSKLKEKREERYRDIVNTNPIQSKFLSGWLNRLNALKYNNS